MNFIKGLLKIIISYCYSIVNNRYKSAWIISERGTDARDNGYYFFEYIRKNYNNINIYYIIDKKSADFEKVRYIGNVIQVDSVQHGIVYFSAKYLMCTHPHLCKPSWRGLEKLEKLNIIKPKGKRIFLQHGIIKDYILGLTNDYFKPDLFICGAKPEYDFIVDRYNHDTNVIKYTGLARYDNLFFTRANQNKEIIKNILIMPTWRRELANYNRDEFIKSDYYNRYQNLLNDKEFIDFCMQNNIKVTFYPHYEIQKWITCFSSISSNIVIANFNDFDVQSLLMECDLLITDYSSVFFDVAYMKKLMIFYQFDYLDYRKNNYSEGYFEYTDSFGPVVDNIQELKKQLINLYCNGNEKRYIDNQKKYFTYNDSNNCKRIYKEVISL